MFPAAFAQAVAERDAVVKDETFAAPAALRFRHAFEVFEDAALEMIDLGKAACEQPGTGLFAADAAGAEHRDFLMLRWVEPVRSEILELPEVRDAGIDRAGEGAHRHLEFIAGVDDERVR